MTTSTPLLFGTHAVLVPVADAAEARTVAAALRPALSEHSLVPGADTVLVTSHNGLAGDRLLATVTAALDTLDTSSTQSAGSTVVIPVRYDGDDLSEVASLLGVSVEEVVTRHTAPAYTVDFLGFAPGFPYLSGLDPVLADVPRLDSPRTRVPAGSVGLAAGRTCIYPTPSPGGWRLLGRTDLALFDAASAERPALLSAGDLVRFEAVTR